MINNNEFKCRYVQYTSDVGAASIIYRDDATGASEGAAAICERPVTRRVGIGVKVRAKQILAEYCTLHRLLVTTDVACGC